MKRTNQRWSRCCSVTIVCCGLLLLAAVTACANNLQVTNVTVTTMDKNTACVSFDISWENAWRYDTINHDAAWVFFKVQKEGDDEWRHVTLESPDEVGYGFRRYDTGIGTPIEIIVPEDRVGMFVRMAEQGTGNVATTNITAVWNISASGLTSTNRVWMQAFGIEMVYVAEGPFYAGSGGEEGDRFYAGSTDNEPFFVDADWSGPVDPETDARRLGDVSGQLWAAGTISVGTLHDGFPTGYDAFYCMKYSMTRGQYADFLNALTEVQAAAHRVSSHHALLDSESSWPNYKPADGPDIGAAGPGGNQAYAFAAWAGLRPMSELEYEKACRGPLTPVPNEYAWGNINITAHAGTSGTYGSGTETATPAGANANYNRNFDRPARVGLYAQAATTREAAGASYWGIMELSGNITEPAVGVNQPIFSGLHGTGVLAADGSVEVAGWPTASNVRGRGGNWYRALALLRVSHRAQRMEADNTNRTYGVRVARTAP